MQGLPVALQPYAKGDVERFEGLVEGLAAANLHHVAKTVRDQRAGMDIPSHNLYAQQGILAGRGDAFSPIYITPKGAHGARRCTVAGTMHKITDHSKPSTPSALYTSPFLLKQFADTKTPESPLRPTTAARAATASAWDGPLDTTTNQSLYARIRAQGQGWSLSHAASPPAPGLGGAVHVAAPPAQSPVDILDVDAERAQEEAEAAPADQPYVFGSLLREAAQAVEEAEAGDSAAPASPYVADAPVDLEEAEETTPPQEREAPRPPTATERLAQAKASAAHDARAMGWPKASAAARRTLNMHDAVSYYETVTVPPPSRPATAGTQAAATNLARQRALESQRSDIFGQMEGRQTWSVGPRVAER